MARRPAVGAAGDQWPPRGTGTVAAWRGRGRDAVLGSGNGLLPCVVGASPLTVIDGAGGAEMDIVGAETDIVGSSGKLI